MKRGELILESMKVFIRVSADLVRSFKLLWILVPMMMIGVIGCSETPFDPADGRSTAQLCVSEALADNYGLAPCGEEKEHARRGRKFEK